MKFELPEI